MKTRTLRDLIEYLERVERECGDLEMVDKDKNLVKGSLDNYHIILEKRNKPLIPKKISDLIGYLISVKGQFGDLDISNSKGQNVYEFEDYIEVNDEEELQTK